MRKIIIMKRIILPFVLGALLVSCSRDEAGVEAVVAPQEPVLEKVFVKSIQKEGEEEKEVFTYDEAKHEILAITDIDEDGVEYAKRTFVYNDKSQIISSEYVNEEERIQDTYHYHNDGTLRQSVSVLKNEDLGKDETITRNYDYSTAGKVLVLHKHEDIANGRVKELTYTYTLNNKQVAERFVKYTDDFSVQSVYEYDTTAKTPFSNVKGLAALMLVEGFNDQDGGFGLEKNVLRVNEKMIETYGSTEKTFRNIWTYNDNKYPTKKEVETHSTLRGNPIKINTGVYIYEY